MEPELLKRYFLGLCSPEEREAVLRWLEQEETLPPSAPQEPHRRAVLGARLWEAVAPAEEPLPARRKTRRAPMPLRRRLAWAAASIALAAGAAGLAVFHDASPGNPQVTARALRALKTADGQKATLTLADGTRIHLNGGTELRYPVDFAHGARDVELEGEAFFEVARDTLRPFTVRTRDTRTRVLGTAFGLRSHPEDATTLLSVTEGRVSFSAAADTARALLVTKGRLARYRAGESAPRAGKGSARESLAWMRGALVFENESLEDIARDLERWYGVKVEIRSAEAARERFTGTYSRPVLRDIARDLSAVLGVRHRLDSRSLVFY